MEKKYFFTSKRLVNPYSPLSIEISQKEEIAPLSECEREKHPRNRVF